MNKVTKKQYVEATKTIRTYIQQKIASLAKSLWKEDEELRAEYKSFDRYLRVFLEESAEDECPGGVEFSYDILSKLTRMSK